MVEIEDIKLFEKAVDERLSGDEAESFQQRLQDDVQFRTNFEKYRDIIAAVHEQQHYDALNIMLEANYKSRNWTLSPEELQNQKTKWPLLLGGVVIVLLIVASVFWLTRDQGSEALVTEPVAAEESMDDVNAQSDINSQEENGQGLENIEITQVEEQEEQTNPTAFMISQGGFFLTQFTPIKGARSLRIRHSDSTEYKVEMAFVDSLLDFAVLKIIAGTWPTSVRLPYRLATTRALVGTEVMVANEQNPNDFSEGVIIASDMGHPDHFYAIEIQKPLDTFGSPVISRNGNVVAMAISVNDSIKFIKSTYLLGTLSANAQQIEGYRPGADNWLAGLERPEQVQRMSPFLFEVIRFY